jgi:hypothetical protein
MSDQSPIQRIKELDKERTTLFEQAKDEALRRATQAVEDLNALGLHYRLVAGAQPTEIKLPPRSLRKQARRALTRSVRPGHRKVNFRRRASRPDAWNDDAGRVGLIRSSHERRIGRLFDVVFPRRGCGQPLHGPAPTQRIGATAWPCGPNLPSFLDREKRQPCAHTGQHIAEIPEREPSAEPRLRDMS